MFQENILALKNVELSVLVNSGHCEHKTNLFCDQNLFRIFTLLNYWTYELNLCFSIYPFVFNMLFRFRKVSSKDFLKIELFTHWIARNKCPQKNRHCQYSWQFSFQELRAEVFSPLSLTSWNKQPNCNSSLLLWQKTHHSKSFCKFAFIRTNIWTGSSILFALFYISGT